MLKEISSENWLELKTLSGNAEHIPEAVMSLLSEDEGAFEAAYWRLENQVVVQGDLYDSAAVLPKYLEEVVLQAKYKSGVLELLFQIGNGTSTDSELESKCFNEVVSVFRRLSDSPVLIQVGLSKNIKSDLGELIEIREERISGS